MAAVRSSTSCSDPRSLLNNPRAAAAGWGGGWKPWCVQGEADRQRELLDVESVAGHLLPAGSVFAFLAEHRGRLFPAEMFADLFPSGRGRPSLPPDVVASVIVLQTLHWYSDREAADAVTFDLRWKAACGYAVDAAGFHPSTLTYWRRRLAASERPQRIFDAVREVITQTGVLAGNNSRSEIFDALYARKTFATSGARMRIMLRVGEVAMGGEGNVRSPVEVHYGVYGTAPLDRFEVVRDGQVVFSGSPKGEAAVGKWLDENVPPGPHVYYLRAVQGDNLEMAWASPVFVTVSKGD